MQEKYRGPRFMVIPVGKGWIVRRRVVRDFETAFPTGTVHPHVEGARAECEEQEKLERARRVLGDEA